MSYQPHYFQEVRKAQQEPYSSYSHFKAEAYLKTKDGRTFYGANIENASYPLSVCAERANLVSAVSQGCRPGSFESTTITVDADKPPSPCGACRRVLKELCDDDMLTYIANHKGDMVMMTVIELLPFGFSGKDLE